MKDNYFFDLPVYRVSKDDYYREKEFRIQKTLYELNFNESHSDLMVEQWKNRLDRNYYKNYGPWDYNEIIGYIKLYFFGSQIRGEYFKVNKKRLYLSRTKTFIWHTFKIAPEREIPNFSDSSEIFEIVCKYIDDCKKILRNRVIDDAVFKKIGSFVNWKELFNLGKEWPK